jgi:hypothetical protein
MLSAKKQAGFVTTRFTGDQLKVIIGQQGLLLRLTMITGRLHFAETGTSIVNGQYFRHMITHFQELAFRILISIQLVFNTDPFVFMKTIERKD